MLSLLCAVPIFRASFDIRKDSTTVPGQPYERYFTHDRFGRDITFYLTRNVQKLPCPLVVFVQGSGDGSNFVERNGRVLPQNGQTTIYDQAKGAIRLLIVEKPGVRYLEAGEQGGATKSSVEFRKEHTLSRWSEAVSASLKAGLKLPGMDRSRVLVVGHSEGGLVACYVAVRNRSVTHVATLAGGGPAQLYDLIALARKGVFSRGQSDPENSVDYLVSEWKKVLAEPESTDKLFLGHPYRRWSSFLSTSPMEELSKFKGQIYIGQGLEDTNVEPSSSDVLYAQLLARGKQVTYDRLSGLTHIFSTKDDLKNSGWPIEMKRVLDWFLK